MGKIFKTAVCQIQVTENKTANLAKARLMIAEAAGAGAKLVVLPEMFNCPYDIEFFPAFAETCPAGETVTMLAGLAKKHDIVLVGGSIPEQEGDRLYNTSFVFDRQGLLARHRKVHLFDVDLAGGMSFKESATLTPGETVTVAQTDLCTLGVIICYDVRFPEILRLMALRGAQVVVVPAAYNMITGPAHWELLLRMRAVDNQVYLVGAAPARDEKAGYVTYGHSAVVEPWGDVIARASEKEEIIYADIDLNRVEQVRKELPLLKHRRTDLYELLAKEPTSP